MSNAKTNGNHSAKQLTKRELFALEILKIELARPDQDASYLANYVAQDAVFQADQLIRVLNGEEPKRNQAFVYTTNHSESNR